MKIEITYTARHGCYVAEATVNGTWMVEASVVSYDAAKAKILDTIRKLSSAPAPEAVEV